MDNSNKYKRFSKSDPCPVCGDGAGHCRKGEAESVFCHGERSARSRDIIDGVDGRKWFCKKADVDQWAIFGEYKGPLSNTPEDVQRRIEESARRKQEQDRRKAEEIARELSPEDFDRELGVAKDQLSLLESDRAHLRERGFSDPQIDEIGFRSLDRGQKISGLSENFPGYHPQYKSLGGGRKSILCPFPGIDGNWIGAQYRLQDLAPDEKARYRWLAGNKIGGELPIACWDKVYRPDTWAIWAVEGTGIKPALAHFKLQVPVIGASGGLFASSPVQFRKTWEFLKNKYRTNKLRVPVDAGDVINPDVTQRLEKQFIFWGQLAIDVEIAWWGQTTKEADDIDELASMADIQYLSVAEWRQLIKKVNTPEPTSPEQDAGAERDDPNWRKWLESRKFTADHEFNAQYVEWGEPKEGELLGLSSPVGTGKTEYLSRLLNRETGVFRDKKVVSFYSRNNLIVNVIKRVDDLIHLNDERSLMAKNPMGKLALCTNSIKKFIPEDFDGAVIVIDEIESVMSHVLCSKTHKSDRIADLKLFGEALQRACCVLVMDGNLTDKTMDWLASKSKNKKVVKVQNTLQPKRAKAEIFLGTPTKSGKYNSNKLSPYIAPLLANDKPFLVLSDSQTKLEQIEKLLIEAGKKGIRLDSKTLEPDSEEKRCLADIKLWVEENQPDYVMGSPAIGLGVDVTNFGYFKDSYIILVGVLGTDDAMQLAGRCRDPHTLWHISCPAKSQVPSNSVFADYFQPAKIAEKLVEYAKQDLSYLKANLSKLGSEFLGWVEEAKDNPDAWYALLLNSKEKFEKDNLRDCLIAALKGAGHELTKVSGGEVAALEAMLKTAKEEVKLQTSKEIFEAADITEEQAEEKAKSWNCTWDDRKEVIKASYKKMLPGIEETEHWNQEFIHYLKWDNPKAIAQANLFHLFHHPHLAEKVQVNAWARIASEGQVFLPDLRSQNLKVECLKFLKLEQFLNPEAMWHKESPELIELAEKAQRPRAIAALGIKPPRDNKGEVDRMDFLRRLLELVGLQLGKCQKRRIGEKRLNCYQLDAEWLANPMRVAIAEAVARRYEAFGEKWVQPEVFTENVAAMSVQVVDPIPEIVEPEADADGVDWRGVLLEVKQAIGHFVAGERVEAVSQPRDNGAGGWLIWVRNTIGQLQLDLEVLELAFD